MRRILLPVLAIALAMGAYWLFRSPDRAPETLDSNSDKVATTAIGGETSTSAKPSAGPALVAPLRMRSAAGANQGGVAPVAAADSIARSYEQEEPDSALAAKHSELIRNTVEELAETGKGTAHIEELDCRARHCRLQLASGDAKGLVKLVDELQDERGFLGVAESIMLSRDGDDIVFYLRFSPPK